MFKGFNLSGENLVSRLKRFRTFDIHVLGSFIFGLPSDTPDTFGATSELADRADLTFAQFLPLSLFPGTVDFEKWEKGQNSDSAPADDETRTRPWLIPPDIRPKLYVSHPTMSADEIRDHTQKVWSSFYSLSKVWRRSRCVSRLRSRLAFVLISKLYHQMYANTGMAKGRSKQTKAVRWSRLIAKPCHALFSAKPMPQLQVPSPTPSPR
jgi:hypothetical protein